MSAIRIRKHLDSETLHVPELREFIGRDVEIVVPEVPGAPALTDATGRRFWATRTLDELAAEQGYTPRSYDALQGPFSSADFEGFEAFLEASRKPGAAREPD